MVKTTDAMIESLEAGDFNPDAVSSAIQNLFDECISFISLSNFEN